MLSLGSRPISLLDEDPDLAPGLSAEDFAQARPLLLAPVENLEPGQWQPPGAGNDELGLLVLDGLLVRELRLGECVRYAELLGPGDFLRPWQEDDGGLLPWASRWRVCEPSRIAKLGRGIARLSARWPEVSEGLNARMMARTRRQSVAASIPMLVRAQDRLVVLFMHLAERWGQVTPDGIVVHVPLTHDLLASLCGARRPTVTTALTALGERGVVRRERQDRWLLGPAIHHELDLICSGNVPQLGERQSVAA